MVRDRGVYVVTAGLPRTLGACWSCGCVLPKHYGGDCEQCIEERERFLNTIPKATLDSMKALEECAKRKGEVKKKATKPIEEAMPLFAQPERRS